MLEKDEFEGWIKASHTLFEIFEGRYDAYPLSVIWIKQWLDFKCFTVDKKHVDRISVLVENFDYEVFGVQGEMKKKIDEQIKSLLAGCLQEGRNENIGFAIAPYLFTWNFRRFKEYFKRRENFSLEQYFRNLGDFLKEQRRILEGFSDKRLISDQINVEGVKRNFYQVNGKLKGIGINNQEPVGTIKLIHAFAPQYFPLIDNKIAKTMGLLHSQWESLTCNSYLKWMNALKNWLLNYHEIIKKLENEHNSSILKLVDEGLYMMITVKQRRRVEELGINVVG